MEIPEGLNALLDAIAERAQEPPGLIAMVVLCAFVLAFVFLALEALFRQWRYWRRDRARDREIARLSGVAAEQQERFAQLLELLRRGQQNETEALAKMAGALEKQVEQGAQLRAEQQAGVERLLDSFQTSQQDLIVTILKASENALDGQRLILEELSKTSRSRVNPAESSVEADPQTVPAESTRQLHDVLSDLPQDPAARITALEQRRTILFRAIRECNRAIEEARRTPPAPPPQPAPDAPSDDPDRDTGEAGQDIPTDETEQPEAVEDGAPVSAAPDPTPTDVDAVDFSRILPEHYECEYLRLICREDGKPTTAQVRVVLEGRMELAVQDNINERAQDILGDVLIYEEEGRLVIPEEYVNELKEYLIDCGSPARRE